MIGASIAYNNANEGPTIHNKIKLGIIVQIISNIVACATSYLYHLTKVFNDIKLLVVSIAGIFFVKNSRFKLNSAYVVKNK